MKKVTNFCTKLCTLFFLAASILSAGIIFSNPNPISIPGSGTSGPASPYPSTITVPAGLGLITDVNLLLNGLYHEWPEDIDILLVGPTGIAVLVWSDLGGSADALGINVVIDDEAGSSGPCFGTIPSGTFQPTNCPGSVDNFAAPAPGGPYASTLAAFDGTDPAGTWRLFVMDNAGGDVGQLANGWALDITTTDSVAIPEPATALMLFGGLAILIGLRRRYSH